MKTSTLSFVIIILLSLIACGEVGTTYEQVTRLQTTSQRVPALNKTIEEVRELEEFAALSRLEDNYLEYEYPIRENESYVVNYRFDNNRCFRIGVDTYFNKRKDAQNVVNGIVKTLKADPLFGLPIKKHDVYQWESVNNEVSIELDIQHIERGTINLIISANKLQ